jgi:HK97 family phage prohead protease
MAVLNDDVRCLGNHSPNILFGRTKNNTATISLTAEGHLQYKCDMPNTTIANDWLELIARGDVNQSSFGFYIKDDEWIERTGETPLRIIHQLERLVDVSPVTYPAYPQTSVAKRSFSQVASKQHARVAHVRTWLSFNK